MIQWQKLSRRFNGTAALNLIWTDIAANHVLGTRSVVPSSTGDNAKKSQTSVPDIGVIFYVNSLRFHMLYGIPVFLTLAMTLLVCGFALISILVQGSGPRRMIQFLNWTSVGASSHLPITITILRKVSYICLLSGPKCGPRMKASVVLLW